VLQNHGLDSGVSQSLAIGAVVTSDGDRDTPVFGNQTGDAIALLGSAVTGNASIGNAVGTFSNTNVITDHAFQRAGDQEKIRNEAFSILDMKEDLKKPVGFRAEGYEAGIDKIADVGVPGIALIKTKGYLHFVVACAALAF
jgi:hypothetical protein